MYDGSVRKLTKSVGVCAIVVVERINHLVADVSTNHRYQLGNRGSSDCHTNDLTGVYRDFSMWLGHPFRSAAVPEQLVRGYYFRSLSDFCNSAAGWTIQLLFIYPCLVKFPSNRNSCVKQSCRCNEEMQAVGLLYCLFLLWLASPVMSSRASCRVPSTWYSSAASRYLYPTGTVFTVLHIITGRYMNSTGTSTVQAKTNVPPL